VRLRLLFLMMLGHETSVARTQEAVGQPAASIRQFPLVKGTNLEGRSFALPSGFESEYNLVFVAFRREQQADVDTWMPFLREQHFAERGVRAYELPTLGRSYRLMRGLIDGGMARGIKDKATREVTITLYIDKSPFKRALAIATEDHVVVLLVARDGRVLWQAEGRFSGVSGGRLTATLDSLGVHMAP
jgi:hypothetical protein